MCRKLSALLFFVFVFIRQVFICCYDPVLYSASIQQCRSIALCVGKFKNFHWKCAVGFSVQLEDFTMRKQKSMQQKNWLMNKVLFLSRIHSHDIVPSNTYDIDAYNRCESSHMETETIREKFSIRPISADIILQLLAFAGKSWTTLYYQL